VVALQSSRPPMLLFVKLALVLMQGIETRASLDMSGMGNANANMPMGGKGAWMAPQIRQGRVIVAVTDAAQGDIFRNAYAQMGAPIECVAAMGPENVWNICQQAYDLLLHCHNMIEWSWNCVPRLVAFPCNEFGLHAAGC
jgi:hypothetical protein